MSRLVEKKSIRDGFGQGLVLAGEADERVVVLTGNLGESTRAHWFARRFPERFFDVGVAEQSLISVAAGMALTGKIPFTTSYAVFSPGRTFEQIKITVSLNDLPVKIIGAHAGFGAGPYGATHQSLEDIAMMRVLPGMVVVVPADYFEARKATLALAKNGRPSYLRLAREESSILTKVEDPFEIGRANLLRPARRPEAAIIGCGPVLAEALSAAKELEKMGIEVEVLNCHTVKPLDELSVLRAARAAGAVVTVEEHQIVGGLGSAVAEVIARSHPVPVEFIGVQGAFSESGTPQELAAKFGLRSKDIIEAVRRVISRKNQ